MLCTSELVKIDISEICFIAHISDNRRQNYTDSYIIRLYNYVMSNDIGKFSPPSPPKTMLKAINVSFQFVGIIADNIESGERE